MDVYVAESFPHEILVFDECKHLFMVYHKGHGQSFQKREYSCSVLEIPTRELARDKWMTGDLAIVEQVDESGVSFP